MAQDLAMLTEAAKIALLNLVQPVRGSGFLAPPSGRRSPGLPTCASRPIKMSSGLDSAPDWHPGATFGCFAAQKLIRPLESWELRIHFPLLPSICGGAPGYDPANG